MERRKGGRSDQDLWEADALLEGQAGTQGSILLHYKGCISTYGKKIELLAC